MPNRGKLGVTLGGLAISLVLLAAPPVRADHEPTTQSQQEPAPIEPLPAWSDGLYFLWNWDLGDSANPTTDADFSVDTEGSLGTGFGFGYRLAGMLRLEGEFHAQWFRVGSLDLGPGAPIVPFDYSGGLQATGLMANLFVDLPAWRTVRPYLGAGYGFSRVDAEYNESICIVICFSTDNKVVDDWDLAEAWQAQAGIAFTTREANSEIYIGYRYFETDDLKLQTLSGTPFTQEGIQSHTLSVGVRFLL